MDVNQIAELLRNELEGCEVDVAGEGSHYNVTVIGDIFADLRPVKKQQLVYAVLQDLIADGRMHAVNIKTYTPQEWQALS